jgi:GT2 family glycosyltransferase
MSDVPAVNQVVGYLDRIDEAGLGGWVVDFADPAAMMRVRMLIDGVTADVVTCDLARDDEIARRLPHPRIGFYYQIPLRFHDGMRHVLSLATLGGVAITVSSAGGVAMRELHFCLRRPVRVEGMIDGLIDGLIQGWVLNVDERAGTQTGGLRVLVMMAGQPVAELLADQYRADVAQARGCEANCGFAFAPAPEWRLAARTAFRFLALPGRDELVGSPIEVAFPDAAEVDRGRALLKRADELFAFAYRLRRDVAAAMPAPRYLLADYARWAAVSQPLAAARAVARYGVAGLGETLVSVICPVFRPEMGAFLMAVDSVRGQSYPHWELLLVDDGSGDAKLAGVMAQMARDDTRVRVIMRPRNGGISVASNEALAAANGAFVAFFDHDDVLAPVALEVMMRARAATGARLLYSDEDKIDQGGALSAPHFKPDYNYRYLLELNYICHFVVAETVLCRALGGLDGRYDGAQDHEFLLRCAERLGADEIHHVPEVLYHWRKSAGSTAAAGAGAKPKAARAGVAAVAAHLKRMRKPAQVNGRGDLTCYQVAWRPTVKGRAVASVAILIPYRNHIEMTADCVAAVRRTVADVPVEIWLLDNWSTGPEAEAFAVAQSDEPGTRVLRIAEPFNYSRINNLGAAATTAPFLLFMNNDVMALEPGWLRRMVDECLADKRVGAVGAKLLYPQGTVQHAGVVLGVGGVADHAFRALPGAAPGYMMRAVVAQEVSAVTGACMLVRRAAFEAVGGFDEAELGIAFNDIDLCMKLRGDGWKIIYAADAVAEHRESISRGDDFDEVKLARFMRENEVMRSRYGAALQHDPFYNANFSRDSGVYKELRLLRPNDI